jgi:hypothetical protein
MARPDAIEHCEYPAIISIDPGGTTGWNVIVVHGDSLSDPHCSILENIIHWEQGQFEGDEFAQADEIITLIDLWDDAAILFEDFILRKFSAGRELLSPVRITSMVAYHISRTYTPPRPIFMQMSELAMSTVTDDRLKKWGLYQPGEQHARDALRHSVTFMRRSKDNKRIREAAWPHIYTK